MRLALGGRLPGSDRSVADELLAVHRSYDAAIRPVLGAIHGLAHITGGGIGGNLVRVLPPGVEAVVEPSAWTWPLLFRVIAEGGRVAVDEMRDVFNLGIGMIAAVPRDRVAEVRGAAEAAHVPTWEIGEVRAGDRGVHFAD